MLEYMHLKKESDAFFGRPIEITEDAFRKIMTYARLCNPYEVYFYAIHHNSVRDLMITDVYLPNQRASEIDVKINERDDTEALEKILGDEDKIIVGWSHSHVNFGVFHSGTDKQNFKDVLYTLRNQKVFSMKKEIPIKELSFDLLSPNKEVTNVNGILINSILSDIVPRVRNMSKYVRNNRDFMDMDSDGAKEKYAYIVALLTNQWKHEDVLKKEYYDVKLSEIYAYSLVVNLRGERLGKVIRARYDEFNNDYVPIPETEIGVNIVKRENVNLSNPNEYKLLSYTPRELAKEVSNKVIFPRRFNIGNNLSTIEHKNLLKGGVAFGR